MPCLLESCRYVLDCVRVFAQLAPRVLPGVADPSLYTYRLLLFYQGVCCLLVQLCPGISRIFYINHFYLLVVHAMQGPIDGFLS